VFLNFIYIVKRGGEWNNARQRLKDITFSALNTATSEKRRYDAYDGQNTTIYRRSNYVSFRFVQTRFLRRGFLPIFVHLKPVKTPLTTIWKMPR